MNLQLAVLIIYSALFIGFGLLISRKVKKADDFLVAGRSLGPGLLATTFLAANIGAGSTVGATGLGYVYGFGAWWWVGSAGIGSFILANTVGPKIWELASKYGWRTVGDFLEYRYHRSVRGTIAILLWVGALMILAGQLIAISQILEVVAGVPKWQGCFIGGVVVTAYFAAGGLLTSAWVNLIQLTVKLTGFALAVPFGLAAAGGWHAVQPALESSAPLGASGIFSYVAILVPSFIVSPGLIQKSWGARSERALRTGIALNAVVLLLFAFAPVLLGMVARVAIPGIEDPNAVLPTVLRDRLPPWLGALALAAVFSTEVDTCDAILFMISTSVSQDLYKRFLAPNASDVQLLRMARLTAVGGGIIGVALAIVLQTVIGALTIFYSLLVVTLFVPVIGGLYSRRARSPAALAAIAAGVGAMFVIRLGFAGNSRWIDPTLVGLMAAAAAFAAVTISRRTGMSSDRTVQ